MTGWIWHAGDSIAAQTALKEHPFQGPDLFGNKTLKIWNESTYSDSWKPFKITPWKPDKKATKAQAKHVEMSQRVFRSQEGYSFSFWALAPSQPGVRWGRLRGTTEFVWLILDGTNGRGVHHALVDKETDEVHWWKETTAHFVPQEEVAAS